MQLEMESASVDTESPPQQQYIVQPRGTLYYIFFNMYILTHLNLSTGTYGLFQKPMYPIHVVISSGDGPSYVVNEGGRVGLPIQTDGNKHPSGTNVTHLIGAHGVGSSLTTSASS